MSTVAALQHHTKVCVALAKEVPDGGNALSKAHKMWPAWWLGRVAGRKNDSAQPYTRKDRGILKNPGNPRLGSFRHFA